MGPSKVQRSPFRMLLDLAAVPGILLTQFIKQSHNHRKTTSNTKPGRVHKHSQKETPYCTSEESSPGPISFTSPSRKANTHNSLGTQSLSQGTRQQKLVGFRSFNHRSPVIPTAYNSRHLSSPLYCGLLANKGLTFKPLTAPRR